MSRIKTFCVTVFVFVALTMVNGGFAAQLSVDSVLQEARKRIEQDKSHLTFTGVFLCRDYYAQTEQMRQHSENERRRGEKMLIEGMRKNLTELNKKGSGYDVEKRIQEEIEYRRKDDLYNHREIRTYIERFYQDGNDKRRNEIMWLDDTRDLSEEKQRLLKEYGTEYSADLREITRRPLSEIKKDLDSNPQAIFGRMQMNRSIGNYEQGGSFYHKELAADQKISAESFLDENKIQILRDASTHESILKHTIIETPILKWGRDLMPPEAVKTYPRDKVPVLLRKEERQDGEEVYVITVGDPSRTPTYFEQKILPKKGYVVTYSCLKISGNVVREDVFDDFHQIERGVWVPFYGKMKSRVKEGKTEDCFSYKEYLALSAPKIAESFPEKLFAMDAVDELVKHVIDKTGRYRVGGHLRPDEIEGYEVLPAQPSIAKWMNTFLFWTGIALISTAMFHFLIRYMQRKNDKRL